MSEETYRAFIALEIPPDVRDIIWSSAKPVYGMLRSLVKWVPVENMHLTLRFLGGISLNKSNELRENLRHISSQFNPIKFKVSEPGVFPSWKEPRILWIGLDAIEGELNLLQGKIEQIVQMVSLPQEKQKFHPHITVGRVKTPSLFISNSWKNVKIQQNPLFVVDRVTLFKSILNPSGAVYEVVDVFQFK